MAVDLTAWRDWWDKFFGDADFAQAALQDPQGSLAAQGLDPGDLEGVNMHQVVADTGAAPPGYADGAPPAYCAPGQDPYAHLAQHAAHAAEQAYPQDPQIIYEVNQINQQQSYVDNSVNTYVEGVEGNVDIDIDTHNETDVDQNADNYAEQDHGYGGGQHGPEYHAPEYHQPEYGSGRDLEQVNQQQSGVDNSVDTEVKDVSGQVDLDLDTDNYTDVDQNAYNYAETGAGHDQPGYDSGSDAWQANQQQSYVDNSVDTHVEGVEGDVYVDVETHNETHVDQDAGNEEVVL